MLSRSIGHVLDKSIFQTNIYRGFSLAHQPCLLIECFQFFPGLYTIMFG